MEKSRKGEAASAVWITGVLKAQLVFLLTGTVLLTLFCWIAHGLEDPDSVTRPLSLAALCLSALAGGIGAVRFTRDGLLSGLVSGTVSVLLLRILTVLPASPSGMETGQMLFFLCLLPVLSVCGAVLGKRRRKNPKHRHR